MLLVGINNTILTPAEPQRTRKKTILVGTANERWLGFGGGSRELHPVISDSAPLLGRFDTVGEPGLMAFTAGDPLQVVEVDLLADGHSQGVRLRAAKFVRQK